ncbi:hypothetical protein NIES2130_13830 [Scytonema sp. HK-05]|nr:hypothetical protein NIES2130_13830 [Scytonema sp. HK-05]
MPTRCLPPQEVAGYFFIWKFKTSINILKLGLSTVLPPGTSRRRDLPSWAVGANLLSNGESMNQESPRMDGRGVSMRY